MEMNIYVLFMKKCKFGIQKHMTFIVWYAVCYMYFMKRYYRLLLII